MVADFGLSRVMEEEKHNLLTEICGTPGVSRHRGCFHCSSSDYRAVHGSRNFLEKSVVDCEFDDFP
jgi:hypothetical protein